MLENFQKLVKLVFGIMLFLFSIILWMLFVVCLDDAGSMNDFALFKEYTSIFLVFAVIYIIFQAIARIGYFGFLFVPVLAGWIEAICMCLKLPEVYGTYITIIAGYNCLFYGIMVSIAFYWLMKSEKKMKKSIVKNYSK